MSPQFTDRSIAVVLGTRPEIIKLAHIIQLLGSAATIVHTGQHFDRELSDIFFRAFRLPAPDAHLAVGGINRASQIASAIHALSTRFGNSPPAAVVVQGDTNSTAAGAIAANALEIPLVHVEAGLRSFDRRMPEEHNRVITDHLADLCLAPTEVNAGNLAAEGIDGDRVAITGNTVVEAVTALLPGAAATAEILAGHGVVEDGYVLATIHRPENVDDPGVLQAILEQLGHLDLPVILPAHPRTMARIEAAGLSEMASALSTTPPLDYAEFLGLASRAALLVSDSGGIQEEASIIKRPVIVVRRSTERPEVQGSFVERVLPGPDIAAVASRWLDELDELHHRLATTPSPYGDGTASERSVAALARLLA
jgi:UDP-N-acetylglucosamine 2-epimerase (non-hydrolysing)